MKTKWILREAGKSLIPQQILERPEGRLPRAGERVVPRPDEGLPARPPAGQRARRTRELLRRPGRSTACSATTSTAGRTTRNCYGRCSTSKSGTVNTPGRDADRRGPCHRAAVAKAAGAQPPALHDAGGDRPSRACRPRRMRAERCGPGALPCPTPDLARARRAPGSTRDARVDAAPLRRRGRAHRRGPPRRLRPATTSSSATRRAGTAIRKTGIEAPLGFGKQLDYRDPRLRGRLQVPVGAQPPPAPGDPGAGLARSPATRATSTRCARTWRAGSTRARIRMGANWASALEAGLRLINWSLAWQLLGGADSPLFAGRAGAALARALARIGLPACRVRLRPLLAAFVGQQPPDRRGRRRCSSRRMTWPHWRARGALARRGAARSSSARRCCRTPPTA